MSSNVFLEETYSETWAEIIHSLFNVHFSMITSPHKNDAKYVFTKIKTILSNETNFTMFQCAKVLRHFGLTYHQLVNGESHKFKEKTNALCYYVYKSVCMYFMSDYLEWNQANNLNVLQFNKTNVTIASFCRFIKDRYKNDEYMKKMENLDNWFSKNAGLSNMQMTTLRRTLIES